MENNNSNSSVTFTKTDGKPITFNFQLENGLPYKPILTPNFETVHSNKTKDFAIYSYLTQSELEVIKNLEFSGYLNKIENNSGEIWLLSNTYYVVFENLNDKIINELKNNNLGFCFFNSNKEFIKGFKFD